MILRASRGATFAEVSCWMVMWLFVFPVLRLINAHFPEYVKAGSTGFSEYIIVFLIAATFFFVAAYRWSRDFYLSIHENMLTYPGGKGKLESLDLNSVAKATFKQNFYQRPFNAGSVFFKMKGWRRRRGFTNIEDLRSLKVYIQEHCAFPVIDKMEK